MKYTAEKSYENIISLEEILPYQLDVFQWLLGYHVNTNMKFANTLRTDNNPDCWLEESYGYLRLIDFGNLYNGNKEYHSKNCIDLVRLKYNCDFKKALQIIFYDCLSKKHNLKPKSFTNKKRESPFQLIGEYKKWDNTDKAFWNGTTGITKQQLELEDCHSLKYLWFTDKNGYFQKVTIKSPTYMNHINDRSKSYTPEHRRFLTNFKATDIGGFKPYNDSKDVWFVSNLKSSLCMNNIDENCHYFPNEGLFLDENYIKDLDTHFNNVYFLLDNNEAGLKASKKLEEQWFRITNNGKGQAKNFPTQYYEETYKNIFNQNKSVEDPYDVCKKWDLDRLFNEVQKLKL
jgi:hypothetical protein